MKLSEYIKEHYNGNPPNAAILAIGAVAFDGTGVLAKFYTEVNLQSAIDMGGGML